VVEHTPGPWEIIEDRPHIVRMPEPCEIGHGNKYVACGGGNNEANARRIVACVNACTGIPTVWLKHHQVRLTIEIAIDMWNKYKAERDELLKVVEATDVCGDYAELIARIKGDNCGSR
jgi:hypothetical protein